jgi:hypothetical protein
MLPCDKDAPDLLFREDDSQKPVEPRLSPPDRRLLRQLGAESRRDRLVACPE